MHLLPLLRAACAIAFLATCGTTLHASKTTKSLRKLPSWVTELKNAVLPSYDNATKFVVLHDTSSMKIDSKGLMTRTTRYAIKILNREGADQAIAYAHYSSDTDKVTDMAAWILKADDEAIIFGRSDVSDHAIRGNGQIVSTGRYKRIDASGDATAGVIFAYEHTIRDDGVFANANWFFQGAEPSLYSSISFDLPEGWTIKPYYFNTDPFDHIVDGSIRTWARHNLPGIKPQDLSPQRTAYLVWMAFTIFPPADSGLKKSLQSFDSWEEIAASYAQQHRARSAVSPEIARKARELTAGATSLWGKIEPLAAYSRSVNYVSVNLDLGTGGGYVPRPAQEILQTNYGDCKDKANLLCSMLSELGITAFPLIVNAEDRDTIYENWPSGSQFNHCIIAIQVGDDYDSDCVIEHPEHGRLLLFDPTSELTSIGDLPRSLQGSKGILLSEESGGLIDIPVVSIENSVLRRRIQAEIFENGSVVAKLQETSIGQLARQERGVYRSEERASEYQKRIQGWISQYLPVPKLTEPVVSDKLDEGGFELNFDFMSPSYSKVVGGALIVFKPILLDRRSSLGFDGEKERTQPLILSPDHLDEESKIFLPLGFKVAELPAALHLEEPFGSYWSELELVEDKLVVRRKLVLNETPIPAEEFATAKQFIEKIITFEQSPVVLERI